MFSIVPVVLVELFLDIYFKVTGEEIIIKTFLYCFVGIGLIEELAKWIISYKVVYKDREFNEAYDAIVYSVFVSLGFALIENILYVISNGALTGLLRAFTSVPAHTCTGVMMGYFLGKAKIEETNNNQRSSNKYMLLSILLPAIIHTLYDTFAFSKMNGSIVLFIICTIFLYVISLILIKKTSKNNVKFNSSEITNGYNFKYAVKNICIVVVIAIIISIVMEVTM